MRLAAIFAVIVGSLAVAGPLRAETVFFRLSPDKKIDDSLTIKVEPVPKKEAGDPMLFRDKFGRFTIKVERIAKKDAGDVLVFHVTVNQKDVGVGNRRSGRLAVFNSKEDLDKSHVFGGPTRVEPTSRDEKLTFSFRVAAKDIEKSRFTYSETEGDRDLGDGHFYWFNLNDFVQAK